MTELSIEEMVDAKVKHYFILLGECLEAAGKTIGRELNCTELEIIKLGFLSGIAAEQELKKLHGY